MFNGAYTANPTATITAGDRGVSSRGLPTGKTHIAQNRWQRGKIEIEVEGGKRVTKGGGPRQACVSAVYPGVFCAVNVVQKV